MIFSGSLDRFNAGDLLLILGQMEKEGMLTVTLDDDALFIAIRDGLVLSAHSRRADGKILRTLFWRKLISQDQLAEAIRVKEETGLPAGRILEQMGLAASGAAGGILGQGLREVLFQLFSAGRGNFHFTDIPTGESSHDALSCQGLTLELMHRVDEWRETVAVLGSLNRIAQSTPQAHDDPDLPPDIRAIVDLAGGGRNLAQIIELAPMTSFTALQDVIQALDSGWLALDGLREEQTGPNPSGPDPMYETFRESFEKIVLSPGLESRIAAVAAFCRSFFDLTMVLWAKSGKMHKVTQHFTGSGAQSESMEIPVPDRDLTTSPIFAWVLESGSPFMGELFATDLFEGVADLPDAGQCGILPLQVDRESQVLAFTASFEEQEGLSPFHYLELIGWLVSPPPENNLLGPHPAPLPDGVENQASSAVPRSLARDKAKVLVKAVEELPAMPVVVTKALELLADPDVSLQDLARVLYKDPALMAQVIRVGNSALYSRGEPVANLSVALARLGVRALRSIVLLASIRALFPTGRHSAGIFAQDLWQHSMECGAASRCVAQAAGYEDPDEALAAGVLHDIGKLAILSHMPEQHPVIRKKQASSGLPSTEVEKQVMGFDHCMIGELLLNKWNMPEPLVQCVQHHHRPFQSEGCRKLVYIVSYGNMLSHMLGAGLAGAGPQNPLDLVKTLTQLNLSGEQNQAVVNSVKELFRNMDME